MARKMKDSGIEWIGEIPEGWELIKAKYLFSPRNEKGNSTLILLSPTQKYGVIPQSQLDGVVQVKESTDLRAFKTIHIGDFVISLRSFQGGFEFSNYEGVCSPAYQVFHATKDLSNDFFRYLFKSDGFISKINSLTVGIREGKNIQYWDFSNMLLAVPPKEVQIRSAQYLNTQCTEIDTMLSKTRSSIEEYKKLKQAVITQAVTKGVRGEREMKDSGVEWIGVIPKEWSVAKAKYCVTITHGSDPKTEGSIPVYGSGAESFKTCGEYKEGPTVLIGRKGATLHIPHYIEGKYWNVDTAFDVKAKNNFSLPYYYYLATSFDYKFYISQTTLPGMTQSNYYNMFLPFPTFPEQEEIVAYLDAKCAEIDKLIAKKEQLVKELESYKKSLIYEVVTGKRKV